IILDFLSSKFAQREIDFNIGDKYIVQAGEVSHIKSDIYFQSEATVADIIQVIHPGPAISGMPQEKALELIDAIEAHDRSFYAGYLGPVSSDSLNTKLFVNLRCMALLESGAQLYLGGGIVKGSDLQSEWEETNLKAQTLLKVLMPESNVSV
ncbi:MAG: hypothetical protein HKN09_03950, partial [Saprospiraceae bacterium]|nr:hypothetical protein [Saprospiraceae bacterium]